MLSLHLTLRRYLQQQASVAMQTNAALYEASDAATMKSVLSCLQIHENFISEEEETLLHREIEPHLARLKYEENHWDNAISSYREVERKHWSSGANLILDRVRKFGFPEDAKHLAMVHCLDLAARGEVKPHIDSVRFCGDRLCGLSLLSDSVYKLVHESDTGKWAKVLLPRRSLYISFGDCRYHYTHAVLGPNESVFCGKSVSKGRRISMLFRVDPED